MKPVPRICVVGSANVDLTFHTQRLPRPGETLAGQAFHVGMGGKGANQAVAAARLGAQVSLVACVGADAFGQQALRSYQADGIDTANVRIDAQQPTGVAAIIVDEQAENCILVVAGANERLSAGDVRRAAACIERSDAVLCQLETPVEATWEAFRIARAAGVRTVLTPAPVASLPDALLALCDVCVPNETELELLTGRTIEGLAEIESAARELRSRGIGAVVVTRGAGGSLVLDDAGATHVPAFSVEAVDPTGAGDAFTAALALHLAAGAPLREAARLASAVAALAVTRRGAQTSFPTAAEVAAWQPRE